MVGEATAVGWGASRDADGENGASQLRRRRPEELSGRGDRVQVPDPDRLRTVLSPTPGVSAVDGADWRSPGSSSRLADASLSLWLERTVTGPWGIFGGGQGAVPAAVLRLPNGEVRDLLKCSHIAFPPESELRVVTGGGGGYGQAGEREAERTADDVANGYVSPEAAREHYGYCAS